MSDNTVSFVVHVDRQVVRSDVPSDIDVVVNLLTSRGIEGQAAKRAINLCLVIDRSGSMNGDKLEQAKRSCLDIFRNLSPEDHFTVLAFDDQVLSVVNPQTPRGEVEERISALQSGGSTNLSKGWYLGILELQTYATDKHINRLILLSDGMANSGEQKSAVLGMESARARDELGITTSTIGIGSDFQEDILIALARESGGRWWYIGNKVIEEIIREEFSGALSVFLERPAVELNLPVGLEVQQEFNELSKTGGRYRLRPIKANDAFAFALRLRSDPTTLPTTAAINATLLDGTDTVTSAEAQLRLGSLQEYAESPEDPSVAMVISKYLAAKADEQMVEEMDKGDITTMIEMLTSQSQLLRELEEKLGGDRAVSWEEKSEAEQRQREAELARAIRALSENDALMSVAQLVSLLQGLGATNEVSRIADITGMLSMARKGRKHRGERDVLWNNVYAADDRRDAGSLEEILQAAREVCQHSMRTYPAAATELNGILDDINGQLARLS
jgi:Ca-activated chloride channel homolog